MLNVSPVPLLKSETPLSPGDRPQGQRISSLDGWRAVAILLVLGDHMLYTNNFPKATLPWWGAAFQGSLGVRIFFVLSGYLITTLLFNEAGRNGRIDLKSFFTRRALRLLPVYYTFIITIAALSLFSLYSDSVSSWIGAATLTRNILGRGDSATVHFWSLAVEQQFYLLWPPIIALFSFWKNRTTALLFLLAIALSCPFIRTLAYQPFSSPHLWQRFLGPNSIIMHTDSLAIGCAGALLLPSMKTFISTNARILLPGCVLAIIGIAQLQAVTFVGSVTRSITLTLQAVSIMIAIYTSVTPSSPGHSFLNSSLMRWLGRLSYSLYVWHILFVGHFVGAKLGTSFLYDWRWWFIPALLVSIVSFYCVEMPALRLKTARFSK